MGKEQYRKYFLNNRMSGVDSNGDLSRMAAMTEALENHATYQEVMENGSARRGGVLVLGESAIMALTVRIFVMVCTRKIQ